LHHRAQNNMLKDLYLLIATCRLWGWDQSKEADEARVCSWDDGEAEEGWRLKEISTEEEECRAGGPASYSHLHL
jgi:hypothetical protein